MGSSTTTVLILFLVSSAGVLIKAADGQPVPAVYVFGDSLVDVGNNNYLRVSLAKADFPHNGIDFPNKKPTGRFCNGKNAADWLAEKLGLPTSPPYLSVKTKNQSSFVAGISFASGGAGIFNGTDQLLTLYANGARKFAMAGVGALGCSPRERLKDNTQDCNQLQNSMATLYNEQLKSMLQSLKSELGNGFSYSYFDTFSVLHNMILNPSPYGFVEVKSACCGLGELRAKVPCLPISNYCPNRRDHVFWDLFHPTEAAAKILIDAFFDGTQQYTYPINLRQLASV
ncbi:GDSL esterase/lipase At5g55050 [Linum perenne]